uniref:Uncharacterized protein n=1 Tax=Arundo donax TaxID=35708 RepID=A0A0A8ZC37_ARUDO
MNEMPANITSIGLLGNFFSIDILLRVFHTAQAKPTKTKMPSLWGKPNFRGIHSSQILATDLGMVSQLKTSLMQHHANLGIKQWKKV